MMAWTFLAWLYIIRSIYHLCSLQTIIYAAYPLESNNYFSHFFSFSRIYWVHSYQESSIDSPTRKTSICPVSFHICWFRCPCCSLAGRWWIHIWRSQQEHLHNTQLSDVRSTFSGSRYLWSSQLVLKCSYYLSSQ